MRRQFAASSWSSLGPATIRDVFGFRSCLFYSSLVLPLTNHLWCDPVVVVMCFTSSTHLYMPGSNSMWKIILACCYKLEHLVGVVCHLTARCSPVIGQTPNTDLNSIHWVVLRADIRSSDAPSVIKQTLRIRFAYLTVYSVSSYIQMKWRAHYYYYYCVTKSCMQYDHHSSLFFN